MLVANIIFFRISVSADSSSPNAQRKEVAELFNQFFIMGLGAGLVFAYPAEFRVC